MGMLNLLHTYFLKLFFLLYLKVALIQSCSVGPHVYALNQNV